MTEARAYSWDELEADHPMDRIARQRIMGEHMMVSRVVLEAGFHADTHRHENEQIAIVIEGRLLFALGEPGSDGYREETLIGGQTMHLPSNVPHGATALERTVVLDLFSPPSEKTGVDRS